VNHPSDPPAHQGLFPQLMFMVLVLPLFLHAQPDDKLICNRALSFAFEHKLTEKKPGDIVVAIGKRFIGSPYEEHTLDTGAGEQLTANLHSFDCVTFVENILALAVCVKNDRFSFEEYRKTLETIRYRGGKRNGYASRLHYFSEWISDNIRKGFVRDLTKDLHGIPRRKTLNFLSTHAEMNRNLQADSVRNQIIATENDLSARPMYVIPVSDFHTIESEISAGDIIAIATTEEGLDVGHTGFAIHGSDGVLHLLHASESGKKVEVTAETLQQYLQKHRKDAGIMVLKILATQYH
jgi:hypothetical protein